MSSLKNVARCQYTDSNRGWDFKGNKNKNEKNYSLNSQIKAIKIQYSMLLYEIFL